MARKGSKKCPALDQPASQPAAPAQILPPLPVTGGLDGEDPGTNLFDPDELPPALAFTPVARKRIRTDYSFPSRRHPGGRVSYSSPIRSAAMKAS